MAAGPLSLTCHYCLRTYDLQRLPAQRLPYGVQGLAAAAEAMPDARNSSPTSGNSHIAPREVAPGVRTICTKDPDHQGTAQPLPPP